MIRLCKHAIERVQERFNGDIHFETKFKWALKQEKRKKINEKKGNKPNTFVLVYDWTTFIYQKNQGVRLLITCY